MLITTAPTCSAPIMENQRRAKWTARARFGLLQSKPCRSLPAQQARLLSHNTGAPGREEAGEGGNDRHGLDSLL